MSSTVRTYATRFLVPPDDGVGVDPGVDGNSRLTGALGAVLLVALFIEGITLVIGVQETLAVHFFVGFLVVPVAVAKIASTSYRMVRYYSRVDGYRRKGPPHPVLRVIGPLVALSTVALLGTGVAMVVVGAASSDSLPDLHQAAFIAWVILMSVHVLGHLVETARLSAGDWTPGRRPVAGGATRRVVVIGTVLVGLVLGVLSVGWANTWHAESESRRSELHRDR